MSIHKDNATGKWRVVYRYTDWTGETHQSSKRGFPTKREAQMWERELLLKKEAKLDMTFESFYEIYVEDMQNRIRDNTWGTKTNIARTKILPYFGKRKIGEIEPRDIIAWQNELFAIRQPNGKPYSASYLQKIHSQLSAIFNHAVNFYHLPSNPAQKAGNMGKEEHREMLFWTKEEYLKFADVMMDKPVSYYAFEILYWCGLRMGELLALTPADFNFETHTLLAAGSGSAAYAMDVGGIQRIVQVWIHGDQTDAIFNVENGNYTLDYKDADGNDVSQGGGGVAYENGTERPLTADELLDEINMPEVEYEEDGTVWVYYLNQKMEITDKFEDGVCFVQLKADGQTQYITVKYQNGYATSPDGYIQPDKFN